MVVFKRFTAVMVAAWVALAVAATPGHAQTLFFNGNPDHQNGLSSEQHTSISQSMVYDNFTVTGSGWTITDLFGYFYDTSDLNSASAVWEIRSGVSAGNGGTLVDNGTSPASFTDQGFADFGLEAYLVDIGSLSIFLNPGTYWLGIAPFGDGVHGRAFVTTTSGSGGVNADLDQVSYFNSAFFGANFVPASGSGELGFASDFSYGAIGTGGPVPEPSTMALLATGLVGLMGAARRRHRA